MTFSFHHIEIEEILEQVLLVSLLEPKEYVLSDDILSWDNAKVACERKNGILAIITNAKENGEIENLMK